LKLRRFFFRSKRANVRLFYHSFIPTVSKTVRPERAAVWKTALPVRAGANVNKYSVQSRILRAVLLLLRWSGFRKTGSIAVEVHVRCLL
jgi:hypothetical protein